ncbi:MAG: LON peptidase substrate-binding domain-containing protein [Alphaproteobacteria bacterium]|nr:LON peptidase substrate-binding domain-containing protein [Alphaproteobacteria bacterium]
MPIAERYLKPSDLPAEIPVFPLRGAILLPRATLPLNIFEPRYLAMVEWVLRNDRVIGVIQPIGGDEEEESPTGKNVDLHAVGCAGRLSAFQELDDGRIAITLTGIARYHVLQECSTDTPFRMMQVDFTRFSGDFEQGRGEDKVDREKLLSVLRRYLDANHMEGDWSSIMRASSEQLINALSIMSPYGPEEKQALLEADELKSRADVLVALAEMELAASGSGEAGGTLQ